MSFWDDIICRKDAILSAGMLGKSAMMRRSER